MPDQFLVHSDYRSDWLPNHEQAGAARLPWAVYTTHPTSYRWTQGTILWLFTVPDTGEGPAICGRLVVAGLKINFPGAATYDERYGSRTLGFDMDVGASRYVRPVRCPLLDGLWETCVAQPCVLSSEIVEGLEKFWVDAGSTPLHRAPGLDAPDRAPQ